jgi:hypothetical protein
MQSTFYTIQPKNMHLKTLMIFLSCQIEDVVYDIIERQLRVGVSKSEMLSSTVVLLFEIPSILLNKESH